MADTYWDPANLLQITESDNASEIQCVGRARSRHNARCRWTLYDSDTTAILRKVKELAASPPSKVAERDLEGLAKLCLCHEYHSGQWLEVAQRWKPVVAKAVKHHERVSKEQASPFELTLLKIQLSLNRADLSASEERRRVVEEELEHAKLKESRLAQEHISSMTRLQESLEAEKVRLTKSLNELNVTRGELAKADAQLSSLRQEVGVARGLLDEELTKTTTLEKAVKEGAEELREARRLLEEARKSRTQEVAQELEQRDRLLAEEKSKTTKVEEATKHLEHRLLEEARRTERLLDEERAKIHALEETKEMLRRQLSDAEARSTQNAAEADKANRDNQVLLQDNAAANKHLDHLRTDLEDLRVEVQRRRDDGSVLARQLQTAQVDKQALLSTHSQLTAQNNALLRQIAALEASLAKCWRRRIRAWLERKKGVLHW